MKEVPKEDPAITAAVIKLGLQQAPAGEQQGFRTLANRQTSQKRFQGLTQRGDPQASPERRVSDVVATGGTASFLPEGGKPPQLAQASSDTGTGKEGSGRISQTQQNSRNPEIGVLPDGTVSAHTGNAVPLADTPANARRAAYDHAVHAGTPEGSVGELEQARRERFKRGDLIGQLRDFFKTSGMYEGARRYLRQPGGIEILVDYNTDFRGRSVLQIRNIEGLDTFKMEADGSAQSVLLPLDPWVDFIHAITDPSFTDGEKFYSGILVSGEADTRINKWCEANGWKRVRPREGSSKTIPDSYLLILQHYNGH